MPDDHNELNDIILNRTDRNDSRKKMLIGIGALAIVLIVVVIIMGSVFSEPKQLPSPTLPSRKATASEAASVDTKTQTQLEAVAEKIKQQTHAAETVEPVVSDPEIIIIDETSPSEPAEPVRTEQPVQQKPKPAPVQKPAVPGTAHTGEVYIQVGSFSRYKPDPKFLEQIKSSGYEYRFHRIVTGGKINNKVLVGPFRDRNDARARLEDVRRKIESGAFIYAIKD